MFSFASKMLNTIMGTEDGQPPGPGQPSPLGGFMSQQQPQGQQQQQQQHQQQQQQMNPGMRPGMQGFPQVRPTPQQGGQRPYGQPPTFSGPRPSPGLAPRGGPPNFGGPPRPMGGAGTGTPHRFSGPQPPPSAAGMPQQRHPGAPQQQQQPGPGGIRPGPPPGVQIRPRGPGPGGNFPPNMQPRLPGAGVGVGVVSAGASSSGGAPVPDVDLSHLSAEERAMIENVMAKAQQLEQEAPPAPSTTGPPGMLGQQQQLQQGPQRMMRPEDQLHLLQQQQQQQQQQPQPPPGGDYGGRLCPLCRQRDITGRDGHPGQECSECRTLVCNRCGGIATHPESKRQEWTCGNCIKRRRMGSAPAVSGASGQQNLGPRPQFGPYSQQQSPNMDWEGGRRSSTGSGLPGPGGPGQQQQQTPGQQRWESDRELENVDESMSKDGVGTWEDEAGQTRRFSSEMTLSSHGEHTEQSEELFLTPSSKSPVDVVDEPRPVTDLPPDHFLSMSTPISVSLSASASKAKPSSSFVKMHSRSISLDMAEADEQRQPSSASTVLNNGFGMHSSRSSSHSPPLPPFQHPQQPPASSSSSTSSLELGGFLKDMTYSSLAHASVPSHLPTSHGPEPTKPDAKTNALMEELSRLQSAVESYSMKRRERQKMENEGDVSSNSYLRLSPSPLSRSRSPSPSPSPKESPGKSGESLSPLPSLSPVYRMPSGGRDSPESPESPFPAPRKAIVMKEHDLDDYKSSTDEDTDSDSDEDRKAGMMGGNEVVTYYDHSPGEVYTIPEEEDEGGSPTGGDLVTSLNRPGIQGIPGTGENNGSPRRRMVIGQECLPGMAPADPRIPLRPQLRPQRSLDNRMPSLTNQNQPPPLDVISQQHSQQQQQQQPTIDSQGNLSYPNNNLLNTQLPTQSMASMDNQSLLNQTSINSSISMSGPLLQSQGVTTPASGPNSLQQYGQTASTSADQSAMDMNARSLQAQVQQQGMLGQQSGVIGGSEWNTNLHMSGHSLLGPTSGLGPGSGSSTDSLQMNQNPNQPYQQQQPSSSLNPQQQVPPVTSQTQLQSQCAMQPQQQQQLQHQLQQQQQLQLQQQQQLQLQQQQQPQLMSLPQQSAQSQLQSSPQHSSQVPQEDGSLHFLPQQQQQQSWQQQQQQPSRSQTTSNQQMYDQSGRPLPPSSVSTSQYSNNQNPNQLTGSSHQAQQSLGQQQQYQQNMNIMSNQQQHSTQGPQAQQQQQLQGLGLGQHHPQQGNASHLSVSTSQAGPGAKSISGLLADFSRALGLGSTSPRPSPSEDKSEPFPIPGSGAGGSGMSGQGVPLSPYDSYSHQQSQLSQQQQQQQQQQQGSLPQHLQSSYPGFHHQQQNVQQSAFAPIQDSHQVFFQRLQHQSNPNQLTQHQLQQQQAQQYSNLHHSHPSLSHQQQMQQQVLTQSGNVLTQQQAASLGVGVVGALSPAQAHMYQQQMALQHQAQHMKKTSRRAHLSSSTVVGDMRRDGGSILIGGQGLAVTPSGMTIGGLTPAVVTSLGTFIGGGPTLSLLSQPLAVTPLGTPIGTPCGTPRGGRDTGAGDSSDTMSETDSQKSLRMRRKLPCLPPDQEAAPLPSTKKRDRQRAQETFRSLSPMRMSSLDNTVPGRSYGVSSLSLSRPSASESNLRKLCMGPDLRPDPVPRPGSALGLLQASSVVSSMGAKSDTVYPLSGNLFSTSATFPGMGLRTTTSGYTATSDLTTTTSVLSGLYPSYKTQDNWSSNMAELAACLPPDLRHLLNKGDHNMDMGSMGGMGSGGMSGLPHGLTSTLGDTSLNVGSHLPSYMRTLREQLQEERRQLLSEERRRLEALRERDRELGARLDAVTNRAGSDSLRSRADLSRNVVGIPRSAGASPLLSSRKLKGHRRQLSDPKLSLPFSPIQEDGDSELQDFDRSSAGILRPPYKSYEYESLEDTALLRPAPGLGDWDHSQSYLASSWAAAGGVLRETAINSMGAMLEDDECRSRFSSRFIRRSSEGEAWPSHSTITRSPVSTRDKRHQMRKHRKSRSWHPSPYVSEEEDDEEEDTITREEKKARIKAEIARRRQQIQEKAGLHHELLRISRLREGPDVHERHSVLKSVDQLLRDQYGRYESSSHGHYGGGSAGRQSMYSSSGQRVVHRGQGGVVTHGGTIISPCASEEDRSIERIASTFRSDDYTSLLYERLGEVSPMATDTESMGSEMGMGSTPAAMPLLPDMPTRSRRLLEDLGSVPIGMSEGGRSSNSSGGNMKGRLPKVGPLDSPGVKPSSTGNNVGGDNPVHASSSCRSCRYPDAYGMPESSSRKPIKSLNKVTDMTSSSSSCPMGTEPIHVQAKKSQASTSTTKYNFPIKRLLLHRDPKDKSVGGMGLGMKIVGGKEIPDSNGRIGAYVAKIYEGGLTDTLGDVHEGDVVLEWNGISLDDKTFEEVQSIVGSSDGEGEVEVVLRSDFDILTGKPHSHTNRLGGHQSSRARRQSHCPPQGGGGGGDESGSRVVSQFTQEIENDKCSPPPTMSYSHNNIHKGRAIDDTPVSVSHGRGLGSGDRCRASIAKSPSSSTEATNTSIATSSIYPPLVTDERSLRTAAFLQQQQQQQSGGCGYVSSGTTGSDSQRPSISIGPTDVSLFSGGEASRAGSRLNSLNDANIGGNSSNNNNNISSTTTHTNSHNPLVFMRRTSSGRHSSGKRSCSSGQVQLQICHDPKANILYVTVLKAKLPKQHNDDGTDHVQVDPYIVVYLLPERILENQRRTRHVPMTSSPQWNQTMVYPGVTLTDLKSKCLEVSAWNYNPTGDDGFFGKVLCELSEEGILDEQPHSYRLKIDEKSTRRRSGQSLNKSINSMGKGSSQKRFSDANSAKDSVLDDGGDKRQGRMSIFSPATAISSQGSMPTDCHAGFCSIL